MFYPDLSRPQKVNFKIFLGPEIACHSEIQGLSFCIYAVSQFKDREGNTETVNSPGVQYPYHISRLLSTKGLV